MKKERLLVIDLSAVFWWKWHASAGESVDSAYEYAVGKVVQLAQAGYDYVVVALDVGPSFRSELYPLYKANRPPRDPACIAQLLRVRCELERRGFLLLSAAGFEADDVIATVVDWASRREGAGQPVLEVVIAGSDKDLLQLVGGHGVTMLGLQTDMIVDDGGVKAKLGVLPYQVRDYLALVGDASDNVKGVPGIGAVKAAKLLAEHKTIAQALDAKDKLEPPAVRKALLENLVALELARKLVTLRTDAPIDCESILKTSCAPSLDDETDAPQGVQDTQSEAREPPASLPVAAATAAGSSQGGNDLGPADAPRVSESGVAASAAPAPHLGAAPPSPARGVEAAPREATKGKPMPTTATGPRFGAAAVTQEPDASPHKFILTGRSGVGKTFFLSTIPRVFILPIEEGLKGASPDHNPARFRVVPRTLAEFREALDAFEALNAPVDGKKPYLHLAIDSLAGLETLVHKHLQTEARVTSMEGKDYQKMWREIEPEFLRLQERLDVLRRRQGVHVWLSAHSAEVIDASSETGETFRKWDLLLRAPDKIGVELRNLWRGWADHVFFLDWAVSVGRKNKGARTIGTIKGRVLHTTESGTHYAKTRSRLPPSMPATWADLAKAIARGVPASDDKLRASLDSLLSQLSPEDVATLGDTSAATGNALAALVSRAQGMVSVAREDEPEEVESAPIEAAS